jgi:hypothetical protein
MIARAVVVAGLVTAIGAAQAAPVPVAPPAASSGPTVASAAAPAAAPASESTAPDPAAIEAGDANLVPTAARTGTTLAAALGGGLLLGVGIEGSTGRGGAVSLRLGHVATPHTVITLELGVTGALHRPKETAPIATNTDGQILVGAQYYANPSLWLRFAGGLGIYQGRQVPVAKGLGDVTLMGPAVLGGLGIDLARFRWAVLDLEFAVSATINSQGILFSNGASVGLAFD